MLLVAASTCMMSTGALATNAACPAVPNGSIIDNTVLATALKLAVQQAGGQLGLGLNMWATVVAADGRVCAVANSSAQPLQGQWLASRVISAQKAFAAATLSLGATANSGSGSPLATGKLALSTANLYTAVQPGGSLYGLQHSNPVAAAGAYGDRIETATGKYIGPLDTNTYGSATDPMLGQVVGGINVFGGGLALYGSPSSKVGGVGVSGDTSCTDHVVAWYLRKNLNLDHMLGVNGVSGDSDRPDNIVFDITSQPGQMPGVSASGWGHPTCGQTNSAATAVAKSLPKVAN
jgi:uncharacterized protein GlcG (DUF336 family)